MIVYTIATIISVLFSMFTLKYRKNNKCTNNAITIIFLCLSALPLIIVSAIRYDVGKDYFYTYVPYFNNLLINHPNTNVEIGYFLLNKLVQVFTTDYIWIFVVCSFIYFFFVYKGIYEQSKNIPLSICLLVITGYYFIFLNTMRQCISVAIIFYALKYVKQRKPIKFAIFIALAFTFHTSALFAIPMYFLYGIKINPKVGMGIIIVTIIFSQLLSGIISNMILQSKYSSYLGVEFGENITGGKVTTAIDLFVLLFAWLYYKKENKYVDKKEYYFHCNLQLCTVIISLFRDIAPLINRVRWYYGFEVILFIPLILSLEENEKNRYIEILGIIGAFALYCFITIGINNANAVLPYQTIFNVVR